MFINILKSLLLRIKNIFVFLKKIKLKILILINFLLFMKINVYIFMQSGFVTSFVIFFLIALFIFVIVCMVLYYFQNIISIIIATLMAKVLYIKSNSEIFINDIINYFVLFKIEKDFSDFPNPFFSSSSSSSSSPSSSPISSHDVVSTLASNSAELADPNKIFYWCAAGLLFIGSIVIIAYYIYSKSKSNGSSSNDITDLKQQVAELHHKIDKICGVDNSNTKTDINEQISALKEQVDDLRINRVLDTSSSYSSYKVTDGPTHYDLTALELSMNTNVNDKIGLLKEDICMLDSKIVLSVSKEVSDNYLINHLRDNLRDNVVRLDDKINNLNTKMIEANSDLGYHIAKLKNRVDAIDFDLGSNIEKLKKSVNVISSDLGSNVENLEKSCYYIEKQQQMLDKQQQMLEQQQQMFDQQQHLLEQELSFVNSTVESTIVDISKMESTIYDIKKIVTSTSFTEAAIEIAETTINKMSEKAIKEN